MRRLALLILTITLSLGISAAAFGDSPNSLRVGMMPAVNSIPLIVAKHDGLFQANGVQVELVMFHNQLYRESGLQTHTIDGSISDLVNAIATVSNGFDIRVTSASEGDFALLASPHAAVQNIAQWRVASGKIQTGSLENSIVNYVSERMLETLKADPGKIDLVPVLNLPSRIQMLLADKLQAAVIPEPYATMARMQGAHLIADTRILPSTPGVLLFTGRAIAEKTPAIRAFYRAYNEAAARVNANPDGYRTIIVAGGDFPPSVTKELVIPHFAAAALPSEAMVEDVDTWMVSKGMIPVAVPYREVTDGDLVK
jgi:NitT/TauT family transport system substrate-binding protein